MNTPGTVLLALVAIAVQIEPARARGEDAHAPVELDPIFITPRHREEESKDVPGAITAVSGEELESRGADNIAALGAMTPNLTIFPGRAFNGTVIAYLRGIGQFDAIWGVEPGVGIYINDVYLARPQGALLDVLDVERMEVLRGPQGTLYGRNALGGAIKVVTREPDVEFGGKLALTSGDYGRLDGKAIINLPFADEFRARVAVAKYDRDGYGRNLTTGGEVGGRDAGVARINALWAPSGEVEVRLDYDRYRDRSGPPPARRLAVPRPSIDPDQTPLDPGRYDVRSDAPEQLDLDNEGASATVDLAFRPDWRLRSVSAWRRGDSQSILDMESLARPAWVLDREFGERQLSQEFQLHHDVDGSHLVAGLYLFEGREAGDGRSATTFFQPTGFYAATGSIRTRSAALFADWVRDLDAHWQFEIGLRYTVERKSITAYNAYYTDASFTTVQFLTGDFTDSATYHAPTPQLALSWRASAAAMLYAKVSRGFKGGSYNVRANAVDHPESAHPLDDETVTTYEFGAKTEWLDGRLSVNATAFRNDYRDIQLSVITFDPDDPNGFPDFVNAGSGTSQGVELEWRARLGPYLLWSGNIGYLDARYDRYIDNGVDVASSRHFPNAPRWTSGASLIAGFPIGEGELHARIDGRYQSEVRPTTDLNPLLLQGGYTLWNASLAWTSPGEQWEVALRGENLGDSAYRTSGYTYPFGVTTGYYGPPRTASLMLAYSF